MTADVGGWEFIEHPWLVGMIVLFVFEVVEGNTVTRLYFMRLRRLTNDALTQGGVTPELTHRMSLFSLFLGQGGLLGMRCPVRTVD